MDHVKVRGITQWPTTTLDHDGPSVPGFWKFYRRGSAILDNSMPTI